jgi:hypothetical protein
MNDPDESPLGILDSATERAQSYKIRLTGVCPNVLVSTHENSTCQACVQYARHVKTEMVATASLNPIPIEDVVKAAQKAFPELEEHLTGALQRELNELKGRFQSLERRNESLKRSLDRLEDDIKTEEVTRGHFEASYEEARRDHLALRQLVRKEAPKLMLPPCEYDEVEDEDEGHRPSSKMSKRTREESPVPTQREPSSLKETHRDKRLRQDAVDDSTFDVDMHVDPRVPVNYGDIQPPLPSSSRPSNKKAKKEENPFEESTDEEEDVTVKQDQRKEIFYAANLPEQYQWILEAQLNDREFKSLRAAAWTAAHKSKELPEGEQTELPMEYSAAIWRSRALKRQRRRALRCLPPIPNLRDLPAQIQALIKEWEQNPRAIHPWVQDEPAGNLSEVDLDTTAWLRVIQPKGKYERSATRRLLIKMSEEFDEISSIIEWDNLPFLTSPWLCERATSCFPWTPSSTTKDLLRWIVHEGGVRRGEALYGIGPYFKRMKDGIWYNTVGKNARLPGAEKEVSLYPESRGGKAKGKGKETRPFPPTGPVKSPQELRRLAYIANGMDPDEAGPSNLPLADRIDAGKPASPSNTPGPSLLSRVERGPPQPTLAQRADMILARASGAGPSTGPTQPMQEDKPAPQTEVEDTSADNSAVPGPSAGGRQPLFLPEAMEEAMEVDHPPPRSPSLDIYGD